MRHQKIIKFGDSYAIIIPKHLVTREMIKNGVYLDVLHYDKQAMLLKLVTADDGKHHTNNQTSRKDT